MSNIFNPDNAFFTTVNKIIDVIWISFLWFFFSVPLFTLFLGVLLSIPAEVMQVLFYVEAVLHIILVGPASTALYYAMVKSVRRDRSYATKCFFHSFKENFKTGAVSSVILGIFAYIMYIDFQWALGSADSLFGKIMFFMLISICVFAVFITVWIFPVLSRFSLGVKALFKNSLFISVKHLIRSFIIIAFWGAIAFLLYNYLEVVANFLIIIAIALPGVSMLLRSFLIEPVLQKYMGEAAGTPEETGEDQWYRE